MGYTTKLKVQTIGLQKSIYPEVDTSSDSDTDDENIKQQYIKNINTIQGIVHRSNKALISKIQIKHNKKKHR